jgi:hypothetical protein
MSVAETNQKPEISVKETKQSVFAEDDFHVTQHHDRFLLLFAIIVTIIVNVLTLSLVSSQD